MVCVYVKSRRYFPEGIKVDLCSDILRMILSFLKKERKKKREKGRKNVNERRK